MAGIFELVFQGLCIGLGSAIGTPIGLFIYESKIKKWITHYDSIEKFIKDKIKEELKDKIVTNGKPKEN